MCTVLDAAPGNQNWNHRGSLMLQFHTRNKTRKLGTTKSAGRFAWEEFWRHLSGASAMIHSWDLRNSLQETVVTFPPPSSHSCVSSPLCTARQTAERKGFWEWATSENKEAIVELLPSLIQGQMQLTRLRSVSFYLANPSCSGGVHFNAPAYIPPGFAGLDVLYEKNGYPLCTLHTVSIF